MAYALYSDVVGKHPLIDTVQEECGVPRMTRHWRDKGDDAKRHHVTIAVSGKLRDRLWAFAAQLGRPPTVVAHDLIEAGVPRAVDEKRGEVG